MLNYGVMQFICSFWCFKLIGPEKPPSLLLFVCVTLFSHSGLLKLTENSLGIDKAI